VTPRHPHMRSSVALELPWDICLPGRPIHQLLFRGPPMSIILRARLTPPTTNERALFSLLQGSISATGIFCKADACAPVIGDVKGVIVTLFFKRRFVAPSNAPCLHARTCVRCLGTNFCWPVGPHAVSCFRRPNFSPRWENKEDSVKRLHVAGDKSPKLFTLF